MSFHTSFVPVRNSKWKLEKFQKSLDIASEGFCFVIKQVAIANGEKWK